MELMSLELKNFKGIKFFHFNTDGGNVGIFGDNGTGKTTLFDAVTWLLFEKDSQNKKDFAIKALDVSGKEINYLDHSVIGTFRIGHKTVTLSRVYREKWTRKRNSATEEFTGHETDYFIDGVPKPKKDYDAYIASIANEDVFRLVTNPAYFNEHLNWKKRRETLLEICGDITDADVIAADESLKQLTEILTNRSLEDHRKVLAARSKEINDRLREIPSRVDEATLGLPEIEGLNRNEIMKQISILRTDHQNKLQEISRVETGGEVAKLQNDLRVIDGQIMDIQAAYKSKVADVVQGKRLESDNLARKAADINASILKKSKSAEDNAAEIKRCSLSRETLKEKWIAVNSRIFEYVEDDLCPACGQILPADQAEAAKQKAKESFNLAKSKELEEIGAFGVRAKAKSDELEKANSGLQEEIDSLIQEKDAAESMIVTLQKETEELAAGGDLTKDPEFILLASEKSSINEKMKILAEERTGIIETLRQEASKIDQDIRVQEADIARLNRWDEGQKRINELKAQEKELTSEYERLKQELFLTEKFVQTKVGMLEEKINQKFKMARFKMFDQQINGGLNECCETIYKGVPYSSGLNNAARINVGLDIIRTMSEHYGFTAPIFVDNAEAVTQLIPMDTQVIRLVVSESDPVLRVVSDAGKMKEAV